MSAEVSSRHAAARIRQLCCLGLGGEMIMPTLLHELHDLIPSYGNCFFWADDKARFANVYDEQAICMTLMPQYFEYFYNRREKLVHRGFTHALRHYHGVIGNDEFFTVDTTTLLASDFYNCIMRAQRNRYFVQLYMRGGGHTLGILQMHRDRRERQFSDRERSTLEQIEPFVAHALIKRPDNDSLEWTGYDESGLIIVDQDGKLLASSPSARHLLILATHPGTGNATSSAAHSREGLAPALAAICRNLTEIFAGRAAGVPVVMRRNNWGQFTFRAYWLDRESPGQGHIGITVSRQIPLTLGLFEGSRGLPLSRRQSEVAMLLARNFSHQEIADRMGLTRNTVISHARWVYAKLEVHDRSSLRERMLDNREVASAWR